MPRLIVRVIGTDEKHGTEKVLAEIKSNQYGPDQLDDLVQASLNLALKDLNKTNLDSLCSWCPEVSISLTADDAETIRPSLHLTDKTIRILSEAGASFDFDPYV
jgi:hypothetical protein